MGSKPTMWLLWCAAVASVVIFATQSTARTWVVETWVVLCLGLAIASTVMHQHARRREKRWNAGDYD